MSRATRECQSTCVAFGSSSELQIRLVDPISQVMRQNPVICRLVGSAYLNTGGIRDAAMPHHGRREVVKMTERLIGGGQEADVFVDPKGIVLKLFKDKGRGAQLSLREERNRST